MAESILSGIAVEVLKKLASTAIEELHSARGYKNEVNKLKNTMDTLKDVLLDAEERQADSRAIRGWLERLAPVVYAADDLFDKLHVVAARKELMGGQKFTRKVRTFFSHSNQVAFTRKVSQNIKEIREQLDAIVKDGTQFEFLRGYPERGSVMVRRDQTISYVDENEVVGRDDAKKAIVDMLLTSSSTGHDEELPVVPIVGMGGMGKTTLAQLIYNDPQVKESFALRLWVCVSDVFDIKAIIEKLLKSATTAETPKLEMDQLQVLWQKEVNNKNYLLVLDDVWNEIREEWLKLRELLKFGGRGSKILVTTRSRKVAEIMGTSPPHELQMLSEENSMVLFEKMAFKPGEAQQKPKLVQIGKEIVQKCGYVPLAIRTVGSLLYGEEESKWLSVKDTSLAKIHNNQGGGIIDILRISYHHLWSPLKNCFAYCALFPKDYEFRKQMLIDLWIAEGYIVPQFDEDQSLDEVAEEYFHMLLQRGFFQNIERNNLEVIESCKMHDFMHDLAQEVAGVKCKVAKSDDKDFNEKSVHLSLAYKLTSSGKIPYSYLNSKLLRTLLLPQHDEDFHPFGKLTSPNILTRFRSLRVLDLKMLSLKSLPSSIGKLIHLRYLNLSCTRIKKLPDSTTDLWNLQTLRLNNCDKLKRLPADLWKLTNLRSLVVQGCFKLTHMPSGLGRLTLLSSVPRFIATKSSRFKRTANLSDLKNLNKLRGNFHIDIRGKLKSTVLKASEANLSTKHGVTELTISFPNRDSDDEGVDFKHAEAVLEALKPASNVKHLVITNYRGQKLPTWTDDICTTLPKVVEITLAGWKRCQQLSAFSKLPFLKRLTLNNMESVEYVESSVGGFPPTTSSKSAEMKTRFFPSLEQLKLSNMKNLKGWWKEVGEILQENGANEVAGQKFPEFMQFSKLSILVIRGCPNLRLSQLPALSQLPFLKRLTLENMESVEFIESGVPPSTSSRSAEIIKTTFFPSLEQLRLNDMKNLKGWWKEEDKIVYGNDTDQVAGQQFPEFMQFSKLSKLVVRECPNLRLLPPCPNVEAVRLWRTNENASVLKMALATTTSSAPSSSSSGSGGSGVKLRVDNAEELIMWLPTHCPLHLITSIIIDGDRKLESTNRLGDVFAALSSSLRSLTFLDCHKLKSIAKGLQHLTALDNLVFERCEALDISGNEAAEDEEEIEEGMPWKALNTNLRSLTLWRLPKLVVLPSGLQYLSNLRSLKLQFNDELVELPEWMSCLSSLESLELCSCPKLTSLPEAISKLTSLNHLQIKYCRGLTKRCKGPNGREWHKIRDIPQLTVLD